MPQSPILIYDDASMRDSFTLAWNNLLADAQNVINLYQALGFGQLANSELTALFTNTAEFVYDKQTSGQPLVINGNTITKSYAMQIVEKPAGYAALMAAVDAMRQQSYQGSDSAKISINLASIAQSIQVSAGVAALTAARTTELQKMGKVYATTPRAIAYATFAQTVIQAYTDSGLSALISADRIRDILGETTDTRGNTIFLKRSGFPQ